MLICPRPMRAALLTGVLLLALGVPAAAGDLPRLAVVPLEGDRPVPAPLPDLVAVRLAESGRVTLVERMEVRKALDEQVLGAAMGTDSVLKLGALLRADHLLLTTVEGTLLRFRLLDARTGLKLADGSTTYPETSADFAAAAATVAGRCLRGVASDPSGEGAVPLAVIGFTGENVSRRHDWVAGVLAAGIEERLVGRAGIAVAERVRLQAIVDEDRITNSLPEPLRGAALLVEGSYKVEERGGADVVSLRVVVRRGREEVGRDELTGSLSDLPGLAALAADRIAARAGAKKRSPPMDPDEEIALLLDEAAARRALREYGRALRLIEGAHALAPDRPELMFLLLDVGREAFLAEVTRGGRRSAEEWEAYYARTVPAAFRRIALAERILANSLPHRLHAHFGSYGWGDSRRSFFVPGVLGLFSLVNLHGGPAGAGEDVLEQLERDLSRLLARYRDRVRGESDHVMASILAEAAKAYPHLVPEGEDPLRFAIGVREEAAALTRRITLPEGPTGLRCGEMELRGPRGEEFRKLLLAHEDPLVRSTGIRAAATSEVDPARPDAGPPVEARYRLIPVPTLGESFRGRRLVSEEGVLAAIGTEGDRLVILRLDPESLEVSLRTEVSLPGRAPKGPFAAAVGEDGSVFVIHREFGLAVVPAEGEPRLLDLAAHVPMRAVASAGGAVFALTGGPHDASGLLRIDPVTGASRLLYSSRSREPTGVLDGRPLRAMCGMPGGESLVIEAGPRVLPGAGDPAEVRARSTFYELHAESGRVERFPGLAAVQPHFLGEGGFVSLRRVGKRALLADIPFIVDLDLESGEGDPLYSIPTVPAVRRIPVSWTGPRWLTPVVRIGDDLICRDRRRLVLLILGEAKPLELGARVAGGPLPAILDAVPLGDGALLLGADRLYRLSRIR